MKTGFTVQHRNTGSVRKSLMILVSNYLADNEVINWIGAVAGDRTRSDIGIWRIKPKSNVEVA